MTAAILERIVTSTREELTRRAGTVPLAALLRAADEQPLPRNLSAALALDGLQVIAEIKRRSPSKGQLAAAVDVAERAAAYEQAGAAAISVLTEGPHFGGSLDDLRIARQATSLPILRKDFMIDAYQVAEARAIGADAILVIMAAVEDAVAHELMQAAADLGMDSLVEVHDESELERALACGARLVGINNRDLGDFAVDLAITERLAPLVPEGVVVVAESGIHTASDAGRVAAAGAAAVLVGESLMVAQDPGAALRALIGATP